MTTEQDAPQVDANDLEGRIRVLEDQLNRYAQNGLRTFLTTPATVPWYVKTVTAAYTVTGQTKLVNADATTAPFTVTLPTAVGRHGQQPITVKRLNAGGNAVTVGAAGGTIDGAATQSLATQYAMLTVVSDGTNWFKVA